MKTKYKYIHFEQTIMVGFWNCINNNLGIVLGVVSYYKPWRQHIFNAECENIVFSQDCLADIIDFIKQLNKSRIGARK